MRFDSTTLKGNTEGVGYIPRGSDYNEARHPAVLSGTARHSALCGLGIPPIAGLGGPRFPLPGPGAEKMLSTRYHRRYPIPLSDTKSTMQSPVLHSVL